MLQEICERLKVTPFKPFSVCTADGRMFEVPHPEFAWMLEEGILHIYKPANGGSERINPALIVSVEGPERWMNK